MKFKTAVKVSLLVLVLLGGFFYLYILKDLPSIEELKSYRPPPGTKVYAADNVLIGEFKMERGKYVSINDIPKALIHAVLATEDSRFFEHKGLEIGRAHV